MDVVSLPSLYLSAPTTPTGCNPQNLQFYSTRSSPVHPGSFGYESGAEKTYDDEFEFGTGWDHEYRLPARANSFSTMAFADELFCNGQFLPLKLPPRLQTSVPTSPRSLTSRMRRPLWNDGFDPFMIALEKVSEETEGRRSVHRRSRSYSPFRNRTRQDWYQEQPQHTRPDTDLTIKKPMVTEIMDRKGSIYSRWVRSQTMVNRTEVQRPAGQTMMKRLWLKKPVKPVKRSELTCTESKMQKMKSVLLRYASLKKETSDSKQTREIMTMSKISYFKRLSLPFKTNRRKKESVDAKMAIVKHETKPSR
ncbi:uncharacterized protein LOC112506075 [Cynara cardunculus var. scolymus]|uniref:uncharacterized protein LOC112506075 n=1 Tax=Cynara cardunculus var. scolymus TaxID=59895 RepID=UPI000D62DFEC|nr:uncharacterized protein LOC112506075 [Cynara cardunculus var. scolymus]